MTQNCTKSSKSSNQWIICQKIPPILRFDWKIIVNFIKNLIKIWNNCEKPSINPSSISLRYILLVSILFWFLIFACLYISVLLRLTVIYSINCIHASYYARVNGDIFKFLGDFGKWYILYQNFPKEINQIANFGNGAYRGHHKNHFFLVLIDPRYII